MTKSLPDFDYVSSILAYDPETGVLTWKRRPQEHFKTAHAWKMWNAKYAGKGAGSMRRKGRTFYREVKIDARTHIAHRLAYLLHHGTWPEGEIDHRDGDGLNNRAINLRDVQHQDNQRNHRMYLNNSSGVNGVHWRKDVSKWRAMVQINGRQQHLGLFDTLEEAAAARLSANKQHEFAERHGHEHPGRNAGQAELAKLLP